MFFIPYGKFQIKTKLGSQQVENLIKDQIVSRSTPHGAARYSHNYFRGDIKNRRFKLIRYSRRGNMLTPVILGAIHGRNGGSIIHLTLRLDFVTAGALLFYVLSYALVIVVIPLMPLFTPAAQEYIQYARSQPDGFYLQMGLGILKVTFTSLFSLYLFLMIPFNIEAGMVLRHLNDMFREDDLVDPPL